MMSGGQPMSGGGMGSMMGSGGKNGQAVMVGSFSGGPQGNHSMDGGQGHGGGGKSGGGEHAGSGGGGQQMPAETK